MKFLKFSIILLLALSVTAAGISLYLAVVRENEMEKRIQVEQIRDQLQEKVDSLISENVELKDKAEKMADELDALAGKYETAESERLRMTKLLHEKETQIGRLNERALKAEQDYQFARKRNEELEKILEGLEAQTRRLLGGGGLPRGGTAFVEMEVSGAGARKSEETSLISQTPLETKTAPSAEIKTALPIQKAEPVTAPPKPKKKRRLFPFFRVKKNGEEVKRKPPQASESTALYDKFAQDLSASRSPLSFEARAVSQPEKQVLPSSAPASAAQPVSAPAPVPAEEAKSAEAKKIAVSEPRRAEQTVAAGSVLLINRKFNFVVANLGSNQGIQMNDLLGIERGGKRIARARVEKLYDDYCAAYLIEEQAEIPVKEGDVVSAV